jgi:hypothetical protein
MVTDVSRQHIGLIFKSKAVQEESTEKFLIECLTHEDETDTLYRKVGDQLLTYVTQHRKRAKTPGFCMITVHFSFI